MRLDDPEHLASFSRAHVMILPQRRRRFLITDANQPSPPLVDSTWT